MYRDESESRLRNQIKMTDVTAVARQKDPKKKERHVFGIFTPSRNYHFEASSDQEAHEWVESIRQEAKIYEAEEEMMLASPGGARSTFQGFGRPADTGVDHTTDDHGGGYSSSDVDALHPTLSSSLPRARSRGHSYLSARQPSILEYSGPEGRGSYSDLSEAGGPAARMSALSLSYPEGRPSTSSAFAAPANSVYGSYTGRPSIGARNPSVLSTSGGDARAGVSREQDPERVVCQGEILLLKSRSGVRKWKKIWMVLRLKGLALYKNDEEYRPLLILPFSNILEAVDIDPISKSKDHCMEIITEERNYRFCADNEETLAKWLGAFKSLISRRRAARKDAQHGS